MEDDSNRKHIAFRIDMSVFFQRNYFRSDVTWRSTAIEEILLLIGMAGQSKVDYDRLKRKSIPEHDVFWFEVTMHHSLLMHFGESGNETFDALPHLRGSEQSVSLLDPVE